MNKRPLILTFWALLFTFVIIASQMLFPVVRDLFRGPKIFLLPFFIFCLLGIVLIFLMRNWQGEKKTKRFLMLTALGSTGFFVFIILHNLFYGLGIAVEHIITLKYLMEVLHVISFIIAIFICPLAYLIGTIGTIILFFRKQTT